ncbi:MAG: hypothetical protein AB1489_13160 [Acidobacteriota bacterium]
MVLHSLPRYFISRAYDKSALPAAYQPAIPIHAIDAFYTNDQGRQLEWIVMTDSVGTLRAMQITERSNLPESIQTEFAYNELAGSRKVRYFDVREFYIFDLQLLEQPTEAPGINDPAYLYGTLYGPYSNTNNIATSAIEGQLTVTRADILEGLVQAAAYPFHYSNTAADGSLSRCFHLLLPGGNDIETNNGESIVLAYPMLPVELMLTNAANEIIINHLLYDLLSALKQDLSREGVEHMLGSMILPVPNRFLLEQQLCAEGYQIKGDTAIRNTSSAKGLSGLLAAVFSSLTSDKLTLPAQGRVDEYIEIARTTINTIYGWPTPRALALRAHVHTTASASAKPIVEPLRQPIEIASPSLTQQPRQERRKLQLSYYNNSGPPAWMQDFITSHQKPGERPPQLTSPLATGRQPSSQSTSTKKINSDRQQTPEWMQDFQSPETDNRPDDDKPSSGTVKPDWLKDFE